MSWETDRMEEMQDTIESLEQDKRYLEDEVENWKEEYESKEREIDELLDENEDLSIKLNSTIKDLDNFVIQCETRGIWSKELTDFLDEYLKFFND